MYGFVLNELLIVYVNSGSDWIFVTIDLYLWRVVLFLHFHATQHLMSGSIQLPWIWWDLSLSQ